MGQPAKLTQEQGELLIQMKLDGYTFKEIEAAVPCHRDTVNARWKKWLAETTEERRAELEDQRSAVIGRLHRVSQRAIRSASGVADARVQAVSRMDDISDDDDAKYLSEMIRSSVADEAKMLTVARQALSDLSRVAGFDAPKQIQMSAAVSMSEAEADAILAESE